MSAMMPQKEFSAALEAARKPRHGGAHPFSLAWANGELSLRQLGAWAIQQFYYIDAVPQQFGHLFSRYPDLDARHHLLENLLGEENPGEPGARHPELLIRFAEACGVGREYVLRDEVSGAVVASSRAMRAWIWELVMVRHLAEASAGMRWQLLDGIYEQAMRRDVA